MPMRAQKLRGQGGFWKIYEKKYLSSEALVGMVPVSWLS
jgi:hypothetical protein